MGSGCNNTNSSGSSSFSYNWGNNNCSPCGTGGNNTSPINADYVIYTGGDLSCISVDPNVTLTELLILLGQAICAGGDPNPDYSGYNTYCVTAVGGGSIETQSDFVEGISKFVCDLQTTLTDFTDDTYTTAITDLQDQIDSINAPATTACVAAGITNADSLTTVLNKTSVALCDIYSQIDVSGVDWDSCFTVNPDPTTITEGFDAVIGMICSLKTLVTNGVVLPTFDNTGSCLPTPLTTTDTLVSTINKIKTKLCQLPTLTIGNLSYGCVDSGSNLEETLQNILDALSSVMTNGAYSFDTDYFTVTPIDPELLCQGKQVTLNTALTDRLVAATATDDTPGTLEDKLEAGDNIDLDFSDPTKVVISAPSISDVKVKINSSDPLSDYLANKVEGSTGDDISITVNVDTSNPSSYKLQVLPTIDYDKVAENVINAILNSSALKQLFCSIECTTSCNPPTNVDVTNDVDKFVMTWLPTASAYQTVAWRQRGDSTWITNTNISPTNPYSFSETTAQFIGLGSNIVYQFKVTNYCSDTVYIDSDTFEQIRFACLVPEDDPATIDVTATTVSIDFGTLTTAHPGINQVKFYIKTALDAPVANATSLGPDFQHTFTGLTAATQYNLYYSLGAVVNGVQVFSEDSEYLNAQCSLGSVTTAAS